MPRTPAASPIRAGASCAAPRRPMRWAFSPGANKVRPGRLSPPPRRPGASSPMRGDSGEAGFPPFVSRCRSNECDCADEGVSPGVFPVGLGSALPPKPGGHTGRTPMTMLSRRGLLAGAAAVTAASSINAPARAAAPMAGKQGPGFYRYKIGDFEVRALSEGSVRNTALQNMALNKSVPDIQKALGDAFLPTDHVTNYFNVLVVNTGKNLVLIDSGFGDNGAPTVGTLIGNMQAAGLDPKTVDTLLVSHFHGH